MIMKLFNNPTVPCIQASHWRESGTCTRQGLARGTLCLC